MIYIKVNDYSIIRFKNESIDGNTIGSFASTFYYSGVGNIYEPFVTMNKIIEIGFVQKIKYFKI